MGTIPLPIPWLDFHRAGHPPAFAYGQPAVCPFCTADASSEHRRDLVLLAEAADDAVRAYAAALWQWNAPDHAHTRKQLRQLVEDVISEGPEVVTHTAQVRREVSNGSAEDAASILRPPPPPAECPNCLTDLDADGYCDGCSYLATVKRPA